MSQGIEEDYMYVSVANDSWHYLMLGWGIYFCFLFHFRLKREARRELGYQRVSFFVLFIFLFFFFLFFSL